MEIGTATLDQVLGMLAATVMSPAMATEIAALSTTLATPVGFTLIDATGTPQSVTLDDSAVAAWLPPSFEFAATALGLKLLGPFPNCMLYADPGRMQPGEGGGEFRGVGYRGFQWMINAAVFANSDKPEIAQRKARMLATCVDRLVWRTHEQRGFGQLVEFIESDGSIDESNAKPLAGHGLVAGARVRFRIATLAP